MFTAAELAHMREAQTGHLPDTCYIQTAVEALDAFRQMVTTFPADSAAIDCGLDMRPGAEHTGVSGTVLDYDATIRLPLGTVVTPKDRIKVTKRFDETLATALIFEIISPYQQGASGLRYRLRRLEP